MMMNAMSYRGYSVGVDYDPRDEIFVGRVIGIVDAITLHGSTVKTLTADFHAAVNHFLADCEAMGRIPQKPYSGRLMLRISPETHARSAAQTALQVKSINALGGEGSGERSGSSARAAIASWSMSLQSPRAARDLIVRH